MNNNVNPTGNENNNVQGVVPTNTVPINTVSTEVLSPSADTTTTTTVNTGMQSNGLTPTSSDNSQNMGNVASVAPMKEVVVDPNKKGGNGKYIMTVLLFIVLLLLIWFMPEVSAYIETLKVKRQPPAEKITTGILKCSMSRNSSNYDIAYSQIFAFTDNKLDKLTYTIETRGDMNLDEKDLDEMNTRCKNIAVMAKELDGINVNCNLSGGTMSEEHIFTYGSIDADKVTSIYTEAGGVYPEYENKQDMDILEKNKKAEGFTCTRIK